LNEAEPILAQIQAPRLALLLRKRVAELAGLSDEEMRSMIRLPEVQRPRRSQPRQTRGTLSLQRRFVLMVLMQPALVSQDDLAWVLHESEEDALVKHALEAAIAYPGSTPAGLLLQLQSRVDARLMRELEREIHLLDEQVDYSLEFEGARKQLRDMYADRQGKTLLARMQEKKISDMTEQEKALLKAMVGATKNRS
jgi:DNA primase